MKFNFEYKGQQGTFFESPVTGKNKLIFNNEELKKDGKIMTTNSGLKFEVQRDNYLFPKLVVEGNEIKLVKLKNWEYAFVILPGLLMLFGGLLPILFGFSGIYLNLSIFTSPDIKPITKILASIGSLIALFVVLLFIAVALRT